MQHLKTYGQQYEDKDKVIKLSTTCARRSQQGLGKYVIPLGSQRCKRRMQGLFSVFIFLLFWSKGRMCLRRRWKWVTQMQGEDARALRGRRSKKVSSIFRHFALCTLHFARCISKRFPQSAATLHSVLCTLHFEKGFSTLHQLLSRRVAAPRPYSWCQRMCGKGLNL